MWSMRPDQVQSFKTAAVRRFEDLMVEHWREFFPAECELMREPQLREMILYGIERAKAYGITAERDVSVFLDVMLVMGRDFDLRAENDWAVRILKETRSSSGDRVMALRDAALEHLSSEEEPNGPI